MTEQEYIAVSRLTSLRAVKELLENSFHGLPLGQRRDAHFKMVIQVSKWVDEDYDSFKIEEEK